MSRVSGLLVFLALTGLFIGLYFAHLPVVETQELGLYDTWLSLRGPRTVSGAVTIVAIDDPSVEAVGRWPWNRVQMARLVRAISDLKPRAVGLDIEFPYDELQDLLGYTDSLAAAVGATSNFYLPVHFDFSDDTPTEEAPRYVQTSAYVLFDDPNVLSKTPYPVASRIYTSVPQLLRVAAGFGHINLNLSQDLDGVARWEACVVEYDSSYYPSFPVTLAMAGLGLNRGQVRVNVGRSIDLGNIRIPTDPAGRMLVNYPGGNRSYTYVSATDVMDGTADREALQDRVVLVGVVASGTTDFFETPVAPRLPGVEKLAAALDDLMCGTALARNELAVILDMWLIAFTGVILGLFLPRMRFAFRLVTIALALILTVLVAYVGLAVLGLWIKSMVPIAMLVVFSFASAVLPIHVQHDEQIEEPPQDAVTMKIDTRKIAQLGSGKVPIEEGTTTRLGRYEVVEVIGKGAMGTVYRGRDPAIDRVVALKTIRLDFVMADDEVNELRTRLYREAQAAGKLTHPNIVIVYDVGEEAGLSYIAMEYLKGKTLELRLHDGEDFTVKTVASIGVQIADAIGYAHEMGVIHRDIKPANIMITDEGNVKVMDFGIARVQSSSITQTGVALGTPNYVSPEQLKGKPVDGRSDQFSLGVVLYEATVGQRPFRGADISSLIYNILNTSQPPVDSVVKDASSEFSRIVDRCLEKDPSKRFGDAKEIAEALKATAAAL
jgi:CHASE2 domain-containing sensor protein/tRNA A-37 threonylcarbamoyl transferase component Bud32